MKEVLQKAVDEAKYNIHRYSNSIHIVFQVTRAKKTHKNSLGDKQEYYCFVYSIIMINFNKRIDNILII